MNIAKIKSRIISKDASLIEAFQQMDRSGHKLLFVFDEEIFLGLLSVGDIQRGILDSFPLDTNIRRVMRSNITYTDQSSTLEEVKNIMLKYRMECLPVVENNSLVDVYFWEDLFPTNIRVKQLDLQLPVIIMAGGKGTRMRPLTNIIPKPLIPIGNKSIIENIMDRFLEVGCTNFHLSVNYKSEMIKFYFDHLKHDRYKIDYFQEESPLGTAGSLHLLKNKINTTFFVSNCDIIINTDYGEVYNFHKQNSFELTIVAALKVYPIPYGTLETGKNGSLTALKEKPELSFQINTGFYILEPHLLDEIPENTFYHITTLMDKIIARGGKIGVYPISEGSWQDIGIWEEYLNLKN